jgi:hypothetical protein
MKSSMEGQMDNTKKFNGIATVYTVGRPTYAESFI